VACICETLKVDRLGTIDAASERKPKIVSSATALDAEQLASEIVRTLRGRGHQAFFAGGCVRDRLLGRRPKDYDVATGALPDEVLSCFPDARKIGERFGVVQVRAAGAEVEVATFRSEHDYRDGRRPHRVRFTHNPEEDVVRRDFTVNGLLYDPIEDRVLDYVGGRADLEARLIRAIGDPRLRFAEDKLRMIRAVRFAAALGFEIEPRTLAAIQERAREIKVVAAERIREELNRILTEGGARRGFELLDETGLLKEILPEAARMKGVPQPPEFHPEGDVWTHTLLMLEGLEKPSVTLALGVLLHDVGKPDTFRVADRIRFDGHVERGVEIAKEIMGRLRYSKREIEQAAALVKHHMRFRDLPRMRPGKLKKFLRTGGFDEHLELHRLDCLGSHRNLENYEFARKKLEEFREEEALRPPRLITGDDLKREGYEPGPAFQRILSEVEEAQLEGRLADRNEALEFVRTRFEPPAGRPRNGAGPHSEKAG